VISQEWGKKETRRYTNEQSAGIVTVKRLRNSFLSALKKGRREPGIKYLLNNKKGKGEKKGPRRKRPEKKVRRGSLSRAGQELKEKGTVTMPK